MRRCYPLEPVLLCLPASLASCRGLAAALCASLWCSAGGKLSRCRRDGREGRVAAAPPSIHSPSFEPPSLSSRLGPGTAQPLCSGEALSLLPTRLASSTALPPQPSVSAASARAARSSTPEPCRATPTPSPEEPSARCVLRRRPRVPLTGKRRYDRKQAGFGGQTKPVFHKKVGLRP